MFLRPQLPTTPQLPAVAEQGQQPACSCHPAPARRPMPAATTGAVAAVLVGGVVLTALLAAVAVTAISVAVAALVLRSLLTGGHRR
ncbi:hypothetical protein SUDANB106_00792 [Streptomyces sp. enrichment culture]|uniref:SpdD protein n=1 Tax=Streptomyces sp. enrichment culture TaxID=1795815 RepID=UPI003F542AA6